MDQYPDITFAKFDTTVEGMDVASAELGVKALPVFKFFKVSVPKTYLLSTDHCAGAFV